MKKNNTKIKEFSDYINEYFSALYSEKREIKSFSFREMENPKGKPLGISAELVYKNFVQYVNLFYGDDASPFMVTTNFKFHMDFADYLCHFSDVLDYYGSEDISCYTYTHCLSKEKLFSAFDEIMKATSEYWEKLNEIALSPDISRSIFNEVYNDEEITEENVGEYSLDCVEDAIDMNYIMYELPYTRAQLRRYLLRRAKKNKLENKFEKRAYEALCNESYVDTAKKQKAREKTNDYETVDKVIMGVILFVFMGGFGLLFGFIGYRLELNLLSHWIGKEHFETACAFFGAGMFIGLLVLSLLPIEVFRPFLPKKRYEALSVYDQTQDMPLALKIICTAVVIAISAFMICFFAFNGMGFTSNNEIVYKKYAFSQEQICSCEEVEIAVVKGYYSKGFNEYGDTAYAFKIGEDWVDYGVPDDDIKPIIENIITDYNKQVETYRTIDDIDT